jgi:hypothetical protein
MNKDKTEDIDIVELLKELYVLKTILDRKINKTSKDWYMLGDIMDSINFIEHNA